MKALVIAQKDIKKLLKSLRFIFSIIVSSLVAGGLLLLSLSPMGRMIFFSAGTFLSPILMAQLIFAAVLPGLILAVFTSNSDLLSRERSEGTILILFSQPVSNMSIILGKFLTIAFTSLVFSLLNVLLLAVALPNLGVTSSLLVPFFFAALLFQLSIGGLTLIFSSLFKRSFLILVMVIFVYTILVILYSSQLTLGISIPGLEGPIPPGYEGVIEGIHNTLRMMESGLRVVLMLGGITLGYCIVTLPGILLSGLSSSLSKGVPTTLPFTPVVNIMEPPIIKFIPINVNAQRIFYFLTSPNPGIEMLEPVTSVFALIGIIALGIFLSLLIIRRARMNYLE